MATSETPFQGELVKSFQACGMHAFKASHRDMTGVVDLWVRSENLGIWTECKFWTLNQTVRTKKISLTRPQWAFMRDEMNANGSCATIIGYRFTGSGRDKHGLFLCDPGVQHIQAQAKWVDDLTHPGHIRKLRGSDWPGQLIVDRIQMMFQGLAPWMSSDGDGVST